MLNILLSVTTTMLIVWIVFIVVSAIIEIETQDLITVWFTLGAIVALIACALKADIIVQLILFVVVSAVAIACTRPLAKKMHNKEIIHTNSDRIIGACAIVTKEISKDVIGEVKIEGRFWRAIPLENEHFSIDEKVIIQAISGTKVIVTKENKNEEITL